MSLNSRAPFRQNPDSYRLFSRALFPASSETLVQQETLSSSVLFLRIAFVIRIIHATTRLIAAGTRSRRTRRPHTPLGASRALWRGRTSRPRSRVWTAIFWTVVAGQFAAA